MLRKACRILVVLAALLLAGLALAVFGLTRGYPRGSGGAVLSPDESHEAVLLDLTERTPREVLAYLVDRRAKEIPRRRRLRLEIVRGRFGSAADEVVASLDLPDAPPPPGRAPRDWIRWHDDGMTVVFLLTHTNVLLHTAEWTPTVSSGAAPGRQTP